MADRKTEVFSRVLITHPLTRNVKGYRYDNFAIKITA